MYSLISPDFTHATASSSSWSATWAVPVMASGFTYRHLFWVFSWLDDAGGELPADADCLIPAADQQHMTVAQHDGDGHSQSLSVACRACGLFSGELLEPDFDRRACAGE